MKRPGGHCGKRDNRTSEPEYWSWVRMMRRCYEPKYRQYKDYGGRGIKVCDEWVYDYLAFKRDMGPKPGDGYSLDRIDSNGNYEPANCRWATVQQQRANRRSALRYTYKGRTLCLAEWSRELGFERDVLRHRLRKLPVDLAFDHSCPLPKKSVQHSAQQST